jgi:hypothetical protein
MRAGSILFPPGNGFDCENDGLKIQNQNGLDDSANMEYERQDFGSPEESLPWQRMTFHGADVMKKLCYQ